MYFKVISVKYEFIAEVWEFLLAIWEMSVVGLFHNRFFRSTVLTIYGFLVLLNLGQLFNWPGGNR